MLVWFLGCSARQRTRLLRANHIGRPDDAKKGPLLEHNGQPGRHDSVTSERCHGDAANGGSGLLSTDRDLLRHPGVFKRVKCNIGGAARIQSYASDPSSGQAPLEYNIHRPARHKDHVRDRGLALIV